MNPIYNRYKASKGDALSRVFLNGGDWGESPHQPNIYSFPHPHPTLTPKKNPPTNVLFPVPTKSKFAPLNNNFQVITQ